MGKNKDKIRVSFKNSNAAEDVTGSCTVITYGNPQKTILVDCGLTQGGQSLLKEYQANSRKFSFKEKEVDYIIITHLHGDHSLLLPRLYKKGCKAPIIFPKGSFDIFKEMALDSAKIMGRNSEDLERKLKKNYPPIYDEEDVKKTLEYVKEYNIGEKIEIDDTLTIEFIPSGHIISACQVVLYIKNGNSTKKIAFTGDLGNIDVNRMYTNEFKPIIKVVNTIVTYIKETIQLYKKLKRIENRAFAGMKGINKIIARAKQVSVGTDVYDGINSKCILYVPAIDGSVYKYDKQYSWGIYIFNQWDYERKYGEKNPKISYDDYSVGVPDSILKHVNVSFNATPTSPVGIYDLCINEDDPSFELYPVVLESMGNLHIKKNTVTLRADTCFINGANASDYVFKYSFDGLQNNETTIPEKDWIKKPVLELGNLIGDGQYSIIWKSKGESRNYDFNYVPGIAFVKISSSIQNVSLQKKQTDNKIYNLNGQRVSDNYRGIVILNGRKVLRK